MAEGIERFVAVALASLGVALLVLIFIVETRREEQFDLSVARRVQAIHAAGFDGLMRLISFPGYPPQVIGLVLAQILVPYWYGFKWVAVSQAFASVGVGVTAFFIKLLVQRARPTPSIMNVHRVLNRGLQSFPAGHAADYVVRFGFLIYLLLSLAPPGWWRMLLILVLGSFIGLVGLSRVYEGEHWFSDVLGGYLLGSIWLILAIYFYGWSGAEVLVQSF